MTAAKKVFCVVLLNFLLIALTVAMIQSTFRIQSSGKIKTIGIKAYGDAECTQLLTEIKWGTLEPSDQKNFTVYLKNTGNSQITITMRTEQWQPASAEQYIALTYMGPSKLESGEVGGAVLTLKVSASVQGFEQFVFDVVLEGSG